MSGQPFMTDLSAGSPEIMFKPALDSDALLRVFSEFDSEGYQIGPTILRYANSPTDIGNVLELSESLAALLDRHEMRVGTYDYRRLGYIGIRSIAPEDADGLKVELEKEAPMPTLWQAVRNRGRPYVPRPLYAKQRECDGQSLSTIFPLRWFDTLRSNQISDFSYHALEKVAPKLAKLGRGVVIPMVMIKTLADGNLFKV